MSIFIYFIFRKQLEYKGTFWIIDVNTELFTETYILPFYTSHESFVRISQDA